MAADPSVPASPVRLRPVGPDDLLAFRRWAEDPEVARHYLGGEWAAPDTWVPELRPGGERLPEWACRRVLRAIEAEGGELVGWVELRDLNWRRRSGELTVCLGLTSRWGQGLGTAAIGLLLAEAFDAHGLQSVHLRVATGNIRALRAYRKLGFRPLGRLRADRRRPAGGEEIWLMVLSADRWRRLLRGEGG